MKKKLSPLIICKLILCVIVYTVCFVWTTGALSILRFAALCVAASLCVAIFYKELIAFLRDKKEKQTKEIEEESNDPIFKNH